jgi:dihydroorotase
MSLNDVVATVTQNPASVLGKSDELGSIAVGRCADISVLEIINGRFKLSDNSGVEVVTDKLVRPVMCLKDGERFDADSPLIPDPVLA